MDWTSSVTFNLLKAFYNELNLYTAKEQECALVHLTWLDLTWLDLTWLDLTWLDLTWLDFFIEMEKTDGYEQKGARVGVTFFYCF